MEAAVKAYRQVTNKEFRDKLVVENLEYVRHVLARTARGLPHFVDVDNLESAGILGLVEAAALYEPERGVEFRTFAHHRIRGAILDELRRNCPLPQEILSQWAVLREACERLGERATPAALADACQISEEQVEETLSAVRVTQPQAWSDMLHIDARADTSAEVTARLQAEEEQKLLTAAIQRLPDRLRNVLSLYYLEDLRLTEIGEVLNLSESRVSRLLSRAQLQLKMIMQQMSDIAPMADRRGT